MTLEQLLQADDPNVLKELSIEQLEEITKPFWPITRPEMVKGAKAQAKGPKIKSLEQMELEQQKQVAIQLAKAHGITLKL